MSTPGSRHTGTAPVPDAGLAKRRPLSGIRVLDFGRVLAGPHCALLLSSLGAEVIKVERPVSGDDSRANAYIYPQGLSGYFMQQNWGKKSVSLDLKRSEAVGIVRRLVERSDVLVENFRPGTMDRMGLGWTALKEINQRLVMCSISAFGQSGPDALRPGYGAIAEARAGIPEMTGEPEGPPMASNVPTADAMAASHAFGAVCAALYARERTGRGDHIDISLLDCAAEMHDWPIQLHLCSGGNLEPTRRGLFDRSIVPWGYFEGNDGWICLIVSNDRFWRKLCMLMDRADLIEHPDYATVEARAGNNHAVYELVGRWVSSWSDMDELVRVLQGADLPADRLQRIPEVVRDPQLRARGMFLEARHPIVGDMTVLNTALRFVESETGLSGLPPLLGQHNREVLRDLGYSSREIDDFEKSGVIYEEPLAR